MVGDQNLDIYMSMKNQTAPKRAYVQRFVSLKVVHEVAFHRGTLKCDYPKKIVKLQTSIAKNNGFTYHCAKRIIEEDVFGASIHCTCKRNSVMRMSTLTMLKNVKSYLPSLLTT